MYAFGASLVKNSTTQRIIINICFDKINIKTNIDDIQ